MALLVRAWGLAAKSLWYDEAYSIFVARQPLVEIPRLLAAYDTHPPLSYVLLHIWMGAFGSSEAAARSLSVVASLGVVVLTFLLGRRLGGARLGILSAALVSLSPFQIAAAQEARMYPLLTLFALGASYVLWLAVEEGRRWQWVAYGLLTLLALYTHHFAVLVLLTHGLFVILFAPRATRKAWILALGAIAVGYLPMFPLVYAQFFTARAWPVVRVFARVGELTDLLAMLSFGGSLFGLGSYFSTGGLHMAYRPAVLLPFALLALFGLAALSERRKAAYVGLLWLAPIASVVALSYRWNLYFSRYFSFTLPPFAILQAAGVLAVSDAFSRHRTAALVAVLLFLAAFYVPALSDMYRAPPLFDWRGLAQHVASRARDDDFILFVPATTRIPFEYYFHGSQDRMSTNPELLIPRNYKPKSSDAPYANLMIATNVDAKKMEEVARTHRRMWIIATVPAGVAARRQMATLLAPYFREVEGKGFGYVYAFLWESRVYRRP